MLHDLYLLSCYFEPTNAVLYADELERRYGAQAVAEALQAGSIQLFRAPCERGSGKCFYRLSPRAFADMERIRA